MKLQTTKEERDELLSAAREAGKSAYAPYSRFRVGAAVLGEHGVYVGANVENASYNLGLCAERSAFASALAQGDRRIRAVAVACIDADAGAGPGELVPCGACRQWFAELARDADIVIDRIDRVFHLDDLLPLPFTLGAVRPGPGRSP